MSVQRIGDEASLRVFQIFEAKRQFLELRALLGSFEEYRDAIQWMREQGQSPEQIAVLVEAGERPWRVG